VDSAGQRKSVASFDPPWACPGRGPGLWDTLDTVQDEATGRAPACQDDVENGDAACPAHAREFSRVCNCAQRRHELGFTSDAVG
jgi:hypothetical protein